MRLRDGTVFLPLINGPRLPVIEPKVHDSRARFLFPPILVAVLWSTYRP